MVGKYEILKAYLDFYLPHEWAHIYDVIAKAGLDVDKRVAANATYNAYKAGHMDKHEEEGNTFRLNEAGIQWLSEASPTEGRRRRSKRTNKPRVSTPTTSRPSSNGTLDFGTLLEVVAVDDKGGWLARDLEAKKAWRVTAL